MYCHILRVRAIPTLESTDPMIQPGQNRCSGILRPLHIVDAQQPCMSQFRCWAVKGIGREACERWYFNQQCSCASLHSHKLLYMYTTVLLKAHAPMKYTISNDAYLSVLSEGQGTRVREPQISQALHVVSSVLCDASDRAWVAHVPNVSMGEKVEQWSKL